MQSVPLSVVSNTENAHYRVEFTNRYILRHCFKCDDGSGLIYDVVISPTITGVYEDSACGKMGNPVQVNITPTRCEIDGYPHIPPDSCANYGYTVTLAPLTYVYSGSGSPDITYRITFSPPFLPMEGAAKWIITEWHVDVTGTNHPCGSSFSPYSYDVRIEVLDPGSRFYSDPNYCPPGCNPYPYR
ncbi:MAG: hypothetical protein QXT45_06430 [Candidatus Bilamarchaeaceae archaeon]